MSRLTTITYPDTTTSSFTYDIRGRRTSVTDQNGKTTSYAYDDADRLTSVTDRRAPRRVSGQKYFWREPSAAVTDDENCRPPQLPGEFRNRPSSSRNSGQAGSASRIR
jgi:YD repeat-containing protein